MKKMTSFLALVLALSIPSGAYAAEAKLDDNNTTANGNVYAVYTEDVPWNSVPVDDDGNAVIDFPDGTSVKIENADKDKNLVVDQVTEKEALDWLNSVMGKKSENTVAFHIYYIDGDSILPANGIIIINSPIGIDAGGVACNFIGSVIQTYTASLLFHRTENMEKLADAFFLAVPGYRIQLYIGGPDKSGGRG